MSAVLEEVLKKTGLIGSIILGGPDPSQGGNITVFEYGFFPDILTDELTSFLLQVPQGEAGRWKNFQLNVRWILGERADGVSGLCVYLLS